MKQQFKNVEFEGNVQINDRVCSQQHGWGTVKNIDLEASRPLFVKFDLGGYKKYTLTGKTFRENQYPDLYWDEPIIPESAITPPWKNVCFYIMEQPDGSFKAIGPFNSEENLAKDNRLHGPFWTRIPK